MVEVRALPVYNEASYRPLRSAAKNGRNAFLKRSCLCDFRVVFACHGVDYANFLRIERWDTEAH